ncbi:MAG: gluconate 2-dehydrogenase subunit 3 family protein [Candidatus Hydrogenedentes bacterium]|nr:gluconate 2-dehydrogenase subunit 3 family protein [Candidatus Hydrogenedentota bacterium]
MNDKYVLQYLTGRRLQVFLAVANRIVPADAESAGAGTVETAAVVDWALRRLDPKLREMFLKLLVAVDVMGVFFGGRRFTRNSAAAQNRQLHWLENAPISKLRMGFFGLKSYVCMGYYTRESTWHEIHYAGPHLHDRAYPDPVIRQLCREALPVRE